MNSKKVLVTGVGVVSPFSLSVEQHFQDWIDGKSAVVIAPDPVFKDSPHLEARVAEFDRKSVLNNRMLRKVLSPSAGYAVGAAQAAIADAGLSGNYPVLEQCGLWVGSLSLEVDPDTFIPALKASLNAQKEFDMSLFARRGMKLLDPLFLVRALPNAAVCGISVELQVLGPNTNFTSGTSSGIMAIHSAAAAIQRGEVDCALAGGLDTLLGMDCIAEHLVANHLSHDFTCPAKACKPFDQNRDGFALGEGAAFVLLESETHAAQRGARPYAELLGYAMTTDTRLIVAQNRGDGAALAQAARLALQQSDCRPEDIGLVVGDGLGSNLDDLREASAFEAIQDGGPAVFTASTASLGFTGAASGAFSFVHACLAIKRQVLPPLINCDHPDPHCKVRFLPEAAQSQFERAMVWNSDRGIKNVAMVLGSS